MSTASTRRPRNGGGRLLARRANAAKAVEEGLADAAWFMPPIAQDRLWELQQRSNGRALGEIMLWLGLLVGFAALAVRLWPSLWSLPVLVIYAGLYGGSADARWHEMSHNTAFQTSWLNEVVYYGEARLYLVALILVLVSALWLWSPLPVLLFGLPPVFGLWMGAFFGITQHTGLQENVLDPWLNTRTVYINPVFRFLYLNMNYHIEHHLFPTVPYYNLPALHREIGRYLPEPLPSTAAAYRELFGAMAQHRVDESFELDRAILRLPAAERRQIAIAGNGPLVSVDGDRAQVLTAGLDVGRVRRVDVGERSFALFRVAAEESVLTDGTVPMAGLTWPAVR